MEKIYKILAIGYIPLSFFSFFMQMAGESAIDATNPVYVLLVDIFVIVAGLIPLLCMISVCLWGFFKKKGRSTFAKVWLLLPLIVFVLNVLLLEIAERIPKNGV